MKWLMVFALPLAFETCQESYDRDLESGADVSQIVENAQLMADLVKASDSLGDVLRQCPLDVYQSQKHYSAPRIDCAASPQMCLSQCLSADRDACFDAANVIQDGDLVQDADMTFPLFMKGCALGHAIACVNAAATAKNGSWSDAPPAQASAPDCQFQTYRRMCDDGTPWGCFMTAQEYDGDDGSQPGDQDTYDRYMRRACALDAGSGACDEEYQ